VTAADDPPGASDGPTQVWVASDGWERPGYSMHTYARRVLGAARAAGVRAAPLPVPHWTNSRHGGVVRPLLNQALRGYPPHVGGIVHDTGVSGTFRGVSVFTIHEMVGFHEPVSRSWLSRFRIRQGIRRARRVVVVSEFLAEEVRREFGARVAERTRTVNVPFESTSDAREPPEFDVLWVGTSEPRKRLELLLGALRAAPSVRAAIRWKPWPTRPDLTRTIEERLRVTPNATSLTDYLDDATLDHLYRRSRCIVSTSSFEGFQAPLMEAYLRGTRVVLSDNGLYPGRLLRGRDGVHVYRDGDAADLGRAIGEAVAAGPFRVDAGVRDAVSYRTTGEQLRAIYEEIGTGS
jgi:glycosyltransferase involved in cell wall biosynthesis